MPTAIGAAKLNTSPTITTPARTKNPRSSDHGGPALNTTTQTRNNAAGASNAPNSAPVTFRTPPRHAGLIDAAYKIGTNNGNKKIK
jgi:hypothetical protein